jgi:Fe-S cluster assembly ATP-binding protein
VADGVNALRAKDRSFLVITHYQRLLNYIVPDYVHVLVDGRIVRSGGKELALELEERGYSWLEGMAPEHPAAQPVGA